MKKLVFFLILINSFVLKAQDTDGGHETWEYILEGSGDVLQLALPLSGLTYSLIEKDYEGTKQLAYSYGTTMAITYSLKHFVKKERPEGRNKYDAFPSGHTSSAFTGAAFIQRRYGWKYGKYAYILASIVGVSRMEGPDGYHDILDVLGGAAVGIGSVYLFTKPHKKSNVQMSFSSNSNGTMLALKWTF
tara:strand:+ start:2180 stop:2746 length:567 start_codon:yes stop_codon:yes gene_type:complete